MIQKTQSRLYFLFLVMLLGLFLSPLKLVAKKINFEVGNDDFYLQDLAKVQIGKTHCSEIIARLGMPFLEIQGKEGLQYRYWRQTFGYQKQINFFNNQQFPDLEQVFVKSGIEEKQIILYFSNDNCVLKRYLYFTSLLE